MKRIYTLLTMLLMVCMGAWSFDVTVINSSVAETTYGSLSSGTFTTNETSGLSGVTVSGVTLLKNTGFAYGSSLGFENVTSGTITLSAPEGYTILGYSLIARSNTYSVSYTLTPAAGGSAVTTSTSGVTLVASGVNSRTTTISYSASKSNSFYIPSLVISIKSDEAELVNVVYKEVYDGAVKRTNDPVSQVVGEAPSLPSGLQTAGCTYKYYTTEACTGEELSTLTSSTTEVYAKVTFTAFTFSSGFDGATWYYVYFNRAAGKKYWQMDPTTTPYPDKTSKPSVSEALWAFTGNPYDGIKVMNARAGDGKYLKKTGSSSGNAITMQEGGDTWVIGTGDGGFTLKQEGTDVFMHDYSSALAVWNSGSAANDKGSAIVVEDAAPVKVTYKLTYNGNVISSYTKDLYELVGATAAAPYDWELPACCSFGSCTPATITAETTEVTIPLNWNGPFEISPALSAGNFASGTKWYVVDIHSNENDYTWQYDASSQEIQTPVIAKDAYVSLTDANLWCFIGNPFDGFKIYNKAAGPTKTIRKATSGNTVSYMSTDDDHNSFVIFNGDQQDSGHPIIANAYSFKLDGDNCYLNHQNSRLEGGTARDQSSCCRFLPKGKYCLNYLNTLNLSAPAGAVGTKDAVTESIRTSLSAVKTGLESDLYYIESLLVMEQTQLSGILSTVASSENITLANGYWRIVSAKAFSSGYRALVYDPSLTSPSSHDISTTIANSIVWTTLDENNYGNIFKFAGSDLTYSILNCNKGEYLSAVNGSTSPTPTDVTLTSLGSCQYNLAIGGSSPIHAQGWNWTGTNGGITGDLTGYPGTANSPSAWYIVKVNKLPVGVHTIGDVAYASLCLPFDVTISNADAYTMVKRGDWLVPTQLEGNQVPAGTAVLLKNNPSVYGETAYATINTGDAFSTSNLNALQGTYVPKDFALTEGATADYFLGVYSGTVGFYRVGIAADNYTLAANRAYLPASAVTAAGARGFAINWDDEVTGIGDATQLKQKEESRKQVFDLQGRRVENPQRGLYIVNGRKVVVK
jgi:hypothetical protein